MGVSPMDLFFQGRDARAWGLANSKQHIAVQFLVYGQVSSTFLFHKM
jgi:hypothetical protein